MKMEERLIAAVKTFPELYNPAMREHKDVHWRAVAWRCIAPQVGISEEEAKKKWRNLRDKYRKERIAEKERRSGLAAEPKRTWKFMPLLQFLEPYVLGRSACSNTGHDTSSETDSPSASEPSPPAAEVPSCSAAVSLAIHPVTPEENCRLTPGPSMPSERPHTPTPGPSQTLHGRSRLSRPRRENSELSEFEAQVMSSLTARQDEDDYFGCSLAETLKRLPPAKKRLLRCRIEHIVYEVEFGDGQQCPVCVSRDTVCPEIKTETE
ncbi:transcription factor Adf-1 [Dicentrarchus labrax]|uniref:transcription factor Adf-1 n=1 Tax=Dicentrarchus labrax TaxID=13489 RepID=UPI0021F5C71C|nr:transcription factor Adf-1 [Dicentrarchus labrax]